MIQVGYVFVGVSDDRGRLGVGAHLPTPLLLLLFPIRILQYS